MELQIKAYKAQPIEFNYEELKTELLTKIADYKTLVYTNDQIQDAKADRSRLNALKKALSDERIRRKKEFLEPFDKFEAQVKELCNLIDEPVQLIDAQVKEYEEKEKSEKRDKCIELFGNIEHPDWLKYEQIENPKWYNKTTSIKAVTEEIEAKINHINVDIKMLSALPDFSFEAIEVYKETIDSGKALVEGNRLADIQKRKEEAERQAQIAEERTETPQIPFASDDVVEITADKEEGKESRVWLSFRAYISKEEAAELRSFFKMYGIEYEAIKEVK